MMFLSIFLRLGLLVAVTALYLPDKAHNSPHEPRATTSSYLQYMGVNIAGFEFGCDENGYCDLAQQGPPLLSLGGPDGAGQMTHFVEDDDFNIFRLPVPWQFLVNNKLGGTLNATNLAKYDALVQACLDTGASCIIDIHNYARWNGGIIGHAGGPTNAQFVSVWTQLAEKYGGAASSARVLFALMNQPHDLGSVSAWAASLQAVVTAVRPLAPDTVLLLPGSSYQSAGALPNGAGPSLLSVLNPDGTAQNLWFDVHQYLDSDLSGTHATCVTDNIATGFAPLAKWLRLHGRKAIVTETGGGNVDSCYTDLCAEVEYLNSNSDVIMGVVGWAAGSFGQSYVLTETPYKTDGEWVDHTLVKECLKELRYG